MRKSKKSSYSRKSRLAVESGYLIEPGLQIFRMSLEPDKSRSFWCFMLIPDFSHKSVFGRNREMQLLEKSHYIRTFALISFTNNRMHNRSIICTEY